MLEKIVYITVEVLLSSTLNHFLSRGRLRTNEDGRDVAEVKQKSPKNTIFYVIIALALLESAFRIPLGFFLSAVLAIASVLIGATSFFANHSRFTGSAGRKDPDNVSNIELIRLLSSIILFSVVESIPGLFTNESVWSPVAAAFFRATRLSLVFCGAMFFKCAAPELMQRGFLKKRESVGSLKKSLWIAVFIVFLATVLRVVVGRGGVEFAIKSASEVFRNTVER